MISISSSSSHLISSHLISSHQELAREAEKAQNIAAAGAKLEKGFLDKKKPAAKPAPPAEVGLVTPRCKVVHRGQARARYELAGRGERNHRTLSTRPKVRAPLPRTRVRRCLPWRRGPSRRAGGRRS